MLGSGGRAEPTAQSNIITSWTKELPQPAATEPVATQQLLAKFSTASARCPASSATAEPVRSSGGVAAEDPWGKVPIMPQPSVSPELPSVLSARERATERAVAGLREQAQMWERQSLELQGKLVACEAQLQRETHSLRGRLQALGDHTQRERIVQEAELARVKQAGEAEVARALHAAEEAQRQTRSLQLVGEAWASREREELESARAELAHQARDKDVLLARQREDFGLRLEEENRRQAQAHGLEAQKAKLVAEAFGARVADLESELSSQSSALARAIGFEKELHAQRLVAARATELEGELSGLRGTQGATEARLQALSDSWLGAEQRGAELRQESASAAQELRDSRHEQDALRIAVREAQLHIQRQAEEHEVQTEQEVEILERVRADAAEVEAQHAELTAELHRGREEFEEAQDASLIHWEHSSISAPKGAAFRRPPGAQQLSLSSVGGLSATHLAQLGGNGAGSLAAATAGSMAAAGPLSETAASSPRQPPQPLPFAGPGSGAGSCSGALPPAQIKPESLQGCGCMAREALESPPVTARSGPVGSAGAAAASGSRCPPKSSAAGCIELGERNGAGSSSRLASGVGAYVSHNAAASPRRKGAGRLPSVLELNRSGIAMLASSAKATIGLDGSRIDSGKASLRASSHNISMQPTPAHSVLADRDEEHDEPHDAGGGDSSPEHGDHGEAFRNLADEWQTQYRMEQEEYRHVLLLGEEWQERSEALEAQLREDSLQWQRHDTDLELQFREAATHEQVEQAAVLLAAQQEGEDLQRRNHLLQDRLEEWEQQGASNVSLLEDAQEASERWRLHNVRLEEQLSQATRQEQAELRCLESDGEALRQRNLLLEVRLSRAEQEREQGAEAADMLQQERAALQQAESNSEAWRLHGLQINEQLQQALRERDRLVEFSNELRADHRRMEARAASPQAESTLEQTLRPPEQMPYLPAAQTPAFTTFPDRVAPAAAAAAAQAGAAAALTAPPVLHGLQAPPPMARREQPVASAPPAEQPSRVVWSSEHPSSMALLGSPPAADAGGPSQQTVPTRSSSSPALATTAKVGEAQKSLAGFGQTSKPQAKELLWPPSPAVASLLPLATTPATELGMNLSGAHRGSFSPVAAGSVLQTPSSKGLWNAATAAGPLGTPRTPQQRRRGLSSTAPGGLDWASGLVTEPLTGGGPIGSAPEPHKGR